MLNVNQATSVHCLFKL